MVQEWQKLEQSVPCEKNTGLITGAKTGVFVVDIDVKDRPELHRFCVHMVQTIQHQHWGQTTDELYCVYQSWAQVENDKGIGRITRNTFTNQMHLLFTKHGLPGKTQATKRKDRSIDFFFSLSPEVVLTLIQKEWDSKFVLLGI